MRLFAKHKHLLLKSPSGTVVHAPIEGWITAMLMEAPSATRTHIYNHAHVIMAQEKQKASKRLEVVAGGGVVVSATPDVWIRALLQEMHPTIRVCILHHAAALSSDSREPLALEQRKISIAAPDGLCVRASTEIWVTAMLHELPFSIRTGIFQQVQTMMKQQRVNAETSGSVSLVGTD